MSFKNFTRELRLFSAAMLSSTKSLLQVVVLLIFILYLFAIVIIQGIIADNEQGRLSHLDPVLWDRFGSLGDAMLSLFMAITSGEDWNNFRKPLMDVSSWFTPFFLFYITFVYLGVMNVLTAIFVESGNRIAEYDRDLELEKVTSSKQRTVAELNSLFTEADTDKSGAISGEELDKQLKNPDILARFELLDMDISEARGFFHLLDTDDTGAVSIHEFVHGMMRLKGAAKGVDIATLLYEHKRLFRKLETFSFSVKACLEEVLYALEPMTEE